NKCINVQGYTFTMTTHRSKDMHSGCRHAPRCRGDRVGSTRNMMLKLNIFGRVRRSIHVVHILTVVVSSPSRIVDSPPAKGSGNHLTSMANCRIPIAIQMVLKHIPDFAAGVLYQVHATMTC